MSDRLRYRVFIVAAGAFLAAASFIWIAVRKLTAPALTLEREEQIGAADAYRLFTGDTLESKDSAFDSGLIDSRLVGEPGNPWQINASGAVIALDIAETRDLDEGALLELHSSYAAAAAACKAKGRTILPSINMLSGKSKQFDDGLYAELDAGMTLGRMKAFNDTRALVQGILEKLDKAGESYAWLWGSLEAGGFLTPPQMGTRPAAADKFINEFSGDAAQSKPVGFYTWSPELRQTFRFLRYLGKQFRDRSVLEPIARVLLQDEKLRAQYRRLLDFYAHLTNPSEVLTVAHLADPVNVDMSLSELWLKQKLGRPGVHTGIYFLPASRSVETELFNRLFGQSPPPPGTDLMVLLIEAIRDGKADLKPGGKSGWYDYQVFALETLLLPQRGPESRKLMLSKRYKERMLQAFKAMVIQRRETHVLHLQTGIVKSDTPPKGPVTPRLRVEPNPTFYVRQARAYAFLEAYLVSVIPAEVRDELRGVRERGKRDRPLMEELQWMKQLFYGLHLISCEDIGLRPSLLDGELGDPEACKNIATGWLSDWTNDADLAVDARVSVPIFIDYVNHRTQFWNTIGVRGMKLSASYARGPRWRSAAGPEAEWNPVPGTQAAQYVLLTDEFAMTEQRGISVLTRDELRKICDREKTRDKIILALQRSAQEF